MVSSMAKMEQKISRMDDERHATFSDASGWSQAVVLHEFSKIQKSKAEKSGQTAFLTV